MSEKVLLTERTIGKYRKATPEFIAEQDLKLVGVGWLANTLDEMIPHALPQGSDLDRALRHELNGLTSRSASAASGAGARGQGPGGAQQRATELLDSSAVGASGVELCLDSTGTLTTELLDSSAVGASGVELCLDSTGTLTPRPPAQPPPSSWARPKGYTAFEDALEDASPPSSPMPRRSGLDKTCLGPVL